jgi:hypothetical protein
MISWKLGDEESVGQTRDMKGRDNNCSYKTGRWGSVGDRTMAESRRTVHWAQHCLYGRRVRYSQDHV